MQDLELHRLDFFVRNVLRPAFDAARLPGADSEFAVAKATVYESYLWLDLGVTLGVFPRQFAERLIAENFTVLYQGFDSFQWWNLFPEVQERLTMARTSKQFFKTEGDFEKVNALHPYFELATLSCGKLIRNIAAQSLIGALLFASDERWQSLTSIDPYPEGILRVFNGNSDPWADGYRDFCYDGLLRVIRHLEELLSSFDEAERPQSVTESDWRVFQSKIRVIHGWRFQFRDNRYVARFRQLGSTLGRMLATDLIGLTAEEGSSKFIAHAEEGSREFVAYLDELAKRWLGVSDPLVFSGSVED